MLRSRLCLCLLAMAGTLLLRAADTTGNVQGSVTDPSAAGVPNAQLELINEQTQVTVLQKTDASGHFIFNLVPPGTYTLRASATGFRTATTSKIQVEVNKTVRADVLMQIGVVAETVDVVAAASRIDTVSAQVSTNVQRQYVTELPSSTRNTLSYAELAPGVTIQNGDSQVMNIEGTYARVNGGRRGRNVFYLDGSDNTGSFRNSGLQFPNPEAVEEVNVSTSNTSAEFGKQPGGTFNVITKSGANAFHGSGFYFFRNENLNANSWSRNKSGSERPPAFLKQGGGTFGGPVRHNKTFFFTSFMLYRDNSNGFQNTVKFPTKAMLGGDFSQFNRPLYDPDTGQPLAGNIIPQRLLDPVAANLLKLVPTVANYGDRYVWSFNNPIQNQEVLGKLDHNFKAQSLAVSYFHTFGDQSQAATAATGNVPAWGPQINASTQDTISARHTWVASPNMVVQSRFAMARLAADRGNANLGKDLSDFGAKWPQNQQGARKYLPQFSVSDGPTASQGWLSYFDQHNFRYSSNLSWVKGKHNIKFGGEAQRDTVRQLNDQDGMNLSFDGHGSSTTGGKATGTGVFGYAIADYIMGRAATFKVSGILDYDIHNWNNFFFVQDEWKVTPRLTITPGLRYELYTPATEKNSRASDFMLNHRSDQYAGAPLNMAFAGDKDTPSGFYSQDHNNFAPRLGISYDPFGNGKTVLRGGVGFFYAYNPTQFVMWTTEAPPWRPVANGGDTTSLVDLWGTSRSVVYKTPPTPFTTDVKNYPYPSRLSSMVGFDGNYRTPYSLQWNLSVAREINKAITIEAGYIGNRSLKLVQELPFNLPVWADNASTSNIEARRPIPGYSQVSLIYSRARSWYDALQVAGDVRLARGLNARFTYAYQNAYELAGDDPTSNTGLNTANPMNWDGERGQSLAHQVLKGWYVYELPFFPDRSRLSGKLLGGWQISGGYNYTTGSPLNVTLGQDWNYDGVSGDRPDRASPIQYYSGSKDQLMARFFDPASFSAPKIHNTFGNLQRNALFGPGRWNTDAALAKIFRITERKQFQVRAEAYNLLNHNNLDDPNTNMQSTDFTRILSRSGSRSMQIGLRLQF